MTPARLEYFRKLFTQSIEGLLGEAGKTVSEMTGGAESFPDVTDRASQESDRNFELRIRDRERKLVKKIKEALQRIDDGTFGACEVCGKKDNLKKRLMARPVTTLCIACKNTTGKAGKTAGRIDAPTQASTALKGFISYLENSIHFIIVLQSPWKDTVRANPISK